MGEVELEKPRCKFCGSTQIYTRSKTKDIVCQTCGKVDKGEEISQT